MGKILKTFAHPSDNENWVDFTITDIRKKYSELLELMMQHLPIDSHATNQCVYRLEESEMWMTKAIEWEHRTDCYAKRMKILDENRTKMECPKGCGSYLITYNMGDEDIFKCPKCDFPIDDSYRYILVSADGFSSEVKYHLYPMSEEIVLKPTGRRYKLKPVPVQKLEGEVYCYEEVV